MYAEERQQIIVGLANRNSRVVVAELAQQFGVTSETVRRDLEALDARGLLRRVHGGAVAATNLALVEPALADRKPFVVQKEAIAQAALAHLPQGPASSIVLDSGTTVARLAALIEPGAVGTIVTNSIPVASQLALTGGATRVRLIGGNVRSLTQACVGGETVAQLASLRCDVAFLGTNGISVRHGFSTPDSEEAEAKRAMAHARRVIVLADSSKIGVETLVRFVDIAQVDVLITDGGLADADQRALTVAGLEVVIAPVPEAASRSRRVGL